MIKVYTAQMSYSGEDRVDITVKSAKGDAHLVAPTWGMVQGYKSGTMSEAAYTSAYLSILERNKAQILKFFYTKDPGEITLVCYCPSGAFCHRVILAEWLQSVSVVFEYKGERKI